MARLKEIKRYANRRLYDAETSKTITLEDVADCIRAGYEVKVVDNISGEDITAKVLGQTFLKIFMENQNLEFSNFLLTALIREVSSNVSDLFSRLIQGGIGAASLTVEKLNKIVQTMVEQGDIQVSDKTNYLDEILDQLREHRTRIDAQAEEGRDVLRTELNRAEGNEQIEALSSKLDEMARLIKDIQSKTSS